MSDPAHDYDALRISTAKLLDIDLANISPTEGLRLDLTALLRLQLDHLQGRALAGQEIDLGKLQACYAMLQKLLPDAIDAPVMREEFIARRRLLELVNSIAEVGESDRVDEVETLTAALAAKDKIIAEKNSVIAALGGEVASKPVVTQQAPSAIADQSSPPSSSSKPPDHYLRATDTIDMTPRRPARWD